MLELEGQMQAGVVRKHAGAADVIAGKLRLKNVNGDPAGFTIFHAAALDLVDLAAALSGHYEGLLGRRGRPQEILAQHIGIGRAEREGRRRGH